MITINIGPRHRPRAGTLLEDRNEWTKAFRRKGHEPVMDEFNYNKIDMFVLDAGYHNGPGCSKCHFSLCHHCHWRQGKNYDDIPECVG